MINIIMEFNWYKIKIQYKYDLNAEKTFYVYVDSNECIIKAINEQMNLLSDEYIISSIILAPKCEGCRNDYLGQEGHMGLNGCLNNN